MRHLLLILALLFITINCSEKEKHELKDIELNTKKTLPLIKDGKPEILSVSASSTLTDPNNKYRVENLIDGTPNSWCMSNSDKGKKEYITIKLKNKTRVKYIYISNGFGDLKHFKSNNRVKEFTIRSPDSKMIQGEILKDSFRTSEKRLRTAIGDFNGIVTDELTITIESVYKGSKWNDTCLNEISFEPFEPPLIPYLDPSDLVHLIKLNSDLYLDDFNIYLELGETFIQNKGPMCDILTINTDPSSVLSPDRETIIKKYSFHCSAGACGDIGCEKFTKRGECMITESKKFVCSNNLDFNLELYGNQFSLNGFRNKTYSIYSQASNSPDIRVSWD